MPLTIRRLHGKMYAIPLFFFSLDAGLSFYSHFYSGAGKTSFYFSTAGIVTGWISFVTGIISFVAIRKNQIAAGLLFIHGFINGMALLVLTALWEKEFQFYPNVQKEELAAVFFKLLMIGILAVGVYLGKTAVRKHL